MSSERKKPVKLQVNLFGAAWKDVVRFDAANDFGSMEVLDAAETLARNSVQQRSHFRIVRDDPESTGIDADVLYLLKADGWKAVTHA